MVEVPWSALHSSDFRFDADSNDRKVVPCFLDRWWLEDDHDYIESDLMPYSREELCKPSDGSTAFIIGNHGLSQTEAGKKPV
jgi:hypothetical protein